jgi:protein-tyrosine phosphatase
VELVQPDGSGDNLRIGGFVDIHAHLLPGIDDGPGDLDQALSMAQAAVGSGIATLATTPHLRSDFPGVHIDELAARHRALTDALEEESIPLHLVPGAEVSVVWAVEASEEELALASYGQRGTDLLLETPWSMFAVLPNVCDLLRAKGYRITLAHPERGAGFHRNPSLLQELVEGGVLLQVNADSLLISGRSPVGAIARRLCTEGLAHAIGSDGHRGEKWRPVTTLAQAVEAAEALVGPDRAHWMTQSAPAAILDGLELPAAPPIVAAPKRRGLFRLR